MRDHHKLSPTLGIVICYLVLVCLHIIMSLFMRGPFIQADEIGYLGNARFLAGKGVMPNMEGTVFYHAGYSILISPAFWLSSDPKRVYLFVLVINSFLISSLFLFLYYWSRNILSYDLKTSVLTGLVTSLYPPFLLHSNIAWAENAIIPLFILPAILFYFLMRNRSLLLGILFGLAVSSLYTVHPRSLPLLPISAFYLIYLVRSGFLPFSIGTVSLIALLSNYLATLKLHGFLRALGWAGGGTPSITGMLSLLPDMKGLVKALVVMVGQLWYIMISTYGLGILGFLVIALRIWQHRSVLKEKEPSSAATHALLFYLLICGGVFLTSVVFMSSLGLNEDRLIYGRYNECFVAVGMAVALGTILENGFNKKYKYTLGLIIILALLGFSLITWRLGANLVTHPTMTGFNLLGLFPVLGAVRYPLQFSFSAGIFVCSLYAWVVILILILAFKVKRGVGLVVLCSLFLMFTVVQHVYLFLPGAKRVESLVLPRVIHTILDANIISYDNASKRSAQLYQYQYFLPHTRFLFFDSSKNETPASDLFISSRLSESAKNMGSHIIALEKEGDLALWVKKKLCKTDGLKRDGHLTTTREDSEENNDGDKEVR